jgi:EAL domain-containing protein (putative c-di-GMP-specific phosphodiesterase class I)
MLVVGEGIETTGQSDALASIDCDQVQGFLFARPQPAEAISGFRGGGTPHPG